MQIEDDAGESVWDFSDGQRAIKAGESVPRFPSTKPVESGRVAQAPTESDHSIDLISQAKAFGYSCVRQLPDGRIAGLSTFMFTTGLVVDIREFGYDHRYCYDTAEAAKTALEIWDGTGHPPGPWLVRKGHGGQLRNDESFAGIPISVERQ